MVQFTDPQEIENIIVEIVQYFDFRRFFVEEDLSTPAERLDIRRVLRDERNDLSSKAVLSAQI